MSAARKSISPLRQLANIILESVDKIESQFTQDGLEYPRLDSPFDPTSRAEARAMAPDVLEASTLIVAACAQLSATVKIPAMSLWDIGGGFHLSSALRTALEGNVVEILRGHSQGLHAEDIAQKNGMHPIRLARVLRILATHHVFVELSPDVFANNRLSSMMDTLKTFEEIKADPKNKHVNTPGFGALMEHTTDEVFKGSAYMADVLVDPKTGSSEDVVHAPMAVALHPSRPSWEWYEEPENVHRHTRYAAAMEGTARADPPDAILQGYDWGELKPGSVVIDVGGGTGHIAMKIYKKYPKLKCVVQERPQVVKQATEYWSRNEPTALSNGTVILQEHDFFTAQPIKDPSVYLLRMIMHDYGKKKASTILSNLRAAAKPDTKLLIVDILVPYACLDSSSKSLGQDIPGAEQPEPPKPLLANLGKANAIAYIADMQMYVGLNGEERTLGTFLELTRESGWKIVRVYKIPGSFQHQILAVPA